MITKANTIGLKAAKRKIVNGIQSHYNIDSTKAHTSYYIYKEKPTKNTEYAQMRNRSRCFVDGKEFPLNCFKNPEAGIKEFHKALKTTGAKYVKGMKKKLEDDPEFDLKLNDNIGSIRISEIHEYARQELKDNDFLIPFDKAGYLRKHHPELYSPIEHITDIKAKHKRAGQIILDNDLEDLFLATTEKQLDITDEIMFNIAVEHTNRFRAKMNYKKGRNNKQWYDFDSSLNCLFHPHYDKLFTFEEGEEGKIDYHFDTPEFDQKARVMIDGLTHFEKMIQSDRAAAYEIEKAHKWLKRGEALGLDNQDRLKKLQSVSYDVFKQALSESDQEVLDKVVDSDSKGKVSSDDLSKLLKTINPFSDRSQFNSTEHKEIAAILNNNSKLSNVKQRALVKRVIDSASMNHLNNHKLQKLVDTLKDTSKNHYAIKARLKELGIEIREHFEYKNVNAFKKGVKNAGRSYSIINFKGIGEFDSRSLPKHVSNQVDRFNEIARVERHLYENQTTYKPLHDYFYKAFINMGMNKGKSLAEIQKILNDTYSITFLPKTKNGEYLSSTFRFHNNNEGIEAKSSFFKNKEEMDQYLRNLVIDYLNAQNEEWDEETLQAEYKRQLIEAELQAEKYQDKYIRIYFRNLSLEQERNAALLFVVGNDYFSRNFSFDGKAYYRGNIKKISIRRNDEDGMTLSLLDDRKDTLILTSEILLNRAITRFNETGNATVIKATQQSTLEFMWIKAQLDPQLSQLVEFEYENGTPFLPSYAAVKELEAQIEAKNKKVAAKLKKQKINYNKFSFKQGNQYQWHLPELRKPYIEHLVYLLDQGVKVSYPEPYLIDDSQDILRAAEALSPNAVVKAQELIDSVNSSYDKAKTQHEEKMLDKRYDSAIEDSDREIDIEELTNQEKTQNFLKNKQKNIDNAKPRQFKTTPINNTVKSLTDIYMRLETVKGGYNGFAVNEKGLNVWYKTLSKANVQMSEQQVYELFKNIKEQGSQKQNEFIDELFKDNPKIKDIKVITKKVVHQQKYKNVKKLQNKPTKPE